MSEPNYDAPATEERWCEERQAQVIEYLREQGVKHGRIGEWPAWHVAPHVSIWAIQSADRAAWVGWWVICGDLPTDYISAEKIKHPREAMRSIAQRWVEVSGYMKSGNQHPTIKIGSLDNRAELAPLLEKRGALLLQWASDDSHWGPEYD